MGSSPRVASEGSASAGTGGSPLGLLRRRIRRVPASVWAITALFAGLGLLHSALSPLAEKTDESTHADLAFHLAEEGGYPEYDGRIISKAADESPYHFRHQPLAPNTPEKRWHLPQVGHTFDELGGAVPGPHGMYNQMLQHPPLYYVTMATAIRVDRAVTGGPSSWFDEWHRLRVVSFAPMLALPLLSWATARRLGADDAASVAAGAFTLAVPQLLNTTSGLNNDTFLVVLGAALAYLLSGVLVGRCERRHAVAVGLVTGLALLTKAFAVVFPLWIAVVFAVRAHRRHAEARRLAARLALAAAVTVAVSGWWWIGNRLHHGTFAPTTESRLYTEAMRPPRFEVDTVWYLTRFAAWLPRRFFGWFGWLSRPLPVGVVVVASIVVAVAAGVALARPGPATSRRSLLAMGAVVPALVVMVFIRAYDLYTITGRTPFIQGRYLFAGFASIATLVGIGLSRLLGRRAPVAVVALAVLLQIQATLVLARPWGEPGASWARSFESVAAWTPGFMNLWVVLAWIGVALVAVLVTIRREGRGREPLAPGPETSTVEAGRGRPNPRQKRIGTCS